MNKTTEINKALRFIKSINQSRSLIQKWIKKLSIPEYAMFSAYAIIGGAAVGIFTVLFHESIDWLTDIFFGNFLHNLLFIGGAAVIIIPLLGMLIQSLMIKMSPDTAKQKGVYDVIKAVAIRKGYIPFKTTIFHFIAPAICIGTGGTVGPEGPAAQIGGGVASKLGSFFGLSDQRRRMFAAAGAGAAIAAVFNTPLGGVFFALEVILLNDFQSPSFSALILASVSASAVSRIFLGDQPAFHFAHTSYSDYAHLYIFIILGFVAGIVSLAFIKYSEETEILFKKKVLKRIPQWSAMAIVGLLVGVSGYFYSDIFGIGYRAIDKILASNMAWDIVLILFVLKFLLVPLILHSGGFGGLFAPTLFMGACLGYLFVIILNVAFGLEVNTTMYVLVGMGALLGGINSIPISAILIIFEMTRDYSFILPLMLAVIISTTIVQVFLKGSVHVKHLEQQGLRISSGREINILKSILVKDIMIPDITTFHENTPLTDLISKLLESPHTTFYTINDKGKITGLITENELRPLISEYENVKGMIVANDIAIKNVNVIYPNENLNDVLKKFEQANIDEFPVVDPRDNTKILGTISRQAIIKAYNKESIKYDLASGMASQLNFVDQDSVSTVAKGYSIIEKRALPEFVGKSLVELRLRNKYGLEVLMIKKKKSPFSDEEEKIIAPDPNYVIKEGDLLVLFGTDEAIEKIKSD